MAYVSPSSFTRSLLDPDHPIMDRVQFALEKQLKGAFDISALKLSEQGEHFRKAQEEKFHASQAKKVEDAQKGSLNA